MPPSLPKLFELRTRTFFKLLLLIGCGSPVFYLIWAFTDSGSEKLGKHDVSGRTEFAVPLQVKSSWLWRGRTKSIYSSITTRNEGFDDTLSPECRVLLTNHGKRTSRIGMGGEEIELKAGDTVEVHEGSLTNSTFKLHGLRRRATDLELRYIIYEPLKDNRYLKLEAHWSAVQF